MRIIILLIIGFVLSTPLAFASNCSTKIIFNPQDMYNISRLHNVTYWANNSDIAISLIAHVNGANKDLDMNLSINGTIVQDINFIGTGNKHEHAPIYYHIPRYSNYTVLNSTDIIQIEWRESNISLDISGCTYPENNDSLNSVIMSLAFVIGLLVAFIVCLICQKRREIK